jgi:hypothetical protein
MHILTLCTACLELVPCYAMTNKMSDDEYAAFIDPDNVTAQILLVHFFMLDYIIEEYALGTMAKPYAFRKEVTMSWVEKTAKRLPASFRRYIVWPVGMVTASRL